VLRFAGFELAPKRAGLIGPDGRTIKLRPKSLDMLQLFLANPGRVLSKQELIEAIWPNLHVGEDSLFQCIREIRAALGDDQRQLIKLVSGRGYVFEAEVSSEPAPLAKVVESTPAAAPVAEERPNRAAASDVRPAPAPNRFRFGLNRLTALAAVAGLVAVIGLAFAASILAPGLLAGRMPPTITVMPIVGAGNDRQVAEMATTVTDRLGNALARIETIRVVTPRPDATPASPARVRSAPGDFVVTGELQRGERSWRIEARMRDAAGEVKWTAAVSVDIEDADLSLQQSRLAAGLGHSLAFRINALHQAGARSAPAGAAGVVIEQAMASITQTTPERFQAAQAMLEKATAAEPDNVDLKAALAAHLLRGIQLAWYDPADVATTARSARSMLEIALRAKPTYLPVLEGYCRFLAATNEFIESLVACARVLSFDPWNGLALYNLGLTQFQLGRFEDALTTFKQADQFDTPRVSRWTWLLGAGISCMLLGDDEEAIRWLQRSIAITPGTGRTHAVLAAAYQRLGRTDEARAALVKVTELRPGSTAHNIALPTRNASPVFLEASERIIRALVEAGLPER